MSARAAGSARVTRATALADLPELLRVPEAARWADVSPGVIYARIASGELPAVRFGRLVRIRRDALAALCGIDLPQDATKRDEVHPLAGRTAS